MTKYSLSIILIILFLFFKGYSQPTGIKGITLEIFDGAQQIMPNDTNYVICPRSYIESSITYMMKETDCDHEKIIVVIKKSTFEAMIIYNVGCGKKRLVFKKGEIKIKD